MSPEVVAFVLTAFLLPLAVSEIRDWSPRLAVGIVRWAARRLGDADACARYEEEWAANVEAVPGKLSSLANALGYLMALPRMRWTLRHAVRQENATPAQLPPAPVELFGRADTLVALDDLFVRAQGRTRSNSPTILLVTGSPGVGKTSVAVHWAHRSRTRFPGGILSANLGGYGQAPRHETGEILDAFLKALGVPASGIPATARGRSQRFRQLTARRQMLILLDDAATAADVIPLLPRTSTCTVLITSRSRLPELGTRDGAYGITLESFTAEDAATMLEHLIGARWMASEPNAARDLLAYLAGLPLAIKVIAQYLADRPDVSLEETVRKLRDIKAHQETDATSMLRVFDMAYEAVDSDAAQLFRRLSVLKGNRVTLRAASKLIDGSAAEVRELLEALVSANLINRLPRRGGYGVHDLLQEYAQQRFEAEEPAHVRATLLSRFHRLRSVRLPHSGRNQRP